MPSQTKETQSTTAERSISDESVLKISKEIAVKFIEVGRITPSTFSHDFKAIFTSIEETVRKKQK